MSSTKGEDRRLPGAPGAVFRAGLLGGILLGLWECRDAIERAPFYFTRSGEFFTLLVGSALIHAILCVAAVGLMVAILGPAVRALLRRPIPGSSLAYPFLVAFLFWFQGIGRALGAEWEAASLYGLFIFFLILMGGLIAALIAPLLAKGWTALFRSQLLRRAAWALIVLMLIVWVFQAMPAEPTGTAPVPENDRAIADRPNLLLVTIDTLRPDHLGCYGNPGLLTPNIDRLAAESVLFADALSPIPITLPSHCSILGSLYPASHGISDNGQILDPGRATLLSETLRAEGYATGAVIAAFPLDSYFGLARGFDEYDDRTEPIGRAAELKRIIGLMTMGRLVERAGIRLTSHRVAERGADRVTARAAEWLAEQGDRPFFLWVHYYDPHAPFEPPPPYDRLYLSGLRRPTLPGGSLEGVDLLAHMRIDGASDLADYQARYEGEVAYTDAWIGRLLGELRRLGFDRNTVVVLAADHGEGLGQHFTMGHTTELYGEQLRVPFMIRAPLPGWSPTVIDGTVRLVDIAPTVLDLVGLAPWEGMDGTSLAPLVREGAEGPPFAYAETPLLGGKQALRAGPWKLIRELESGRRLLFDIHADPAERTDRSTDPALSDLLGRLEEAVGSHPSVVGGGSSDEETLPDEIRERLKALGYL